jgi:membrane associated rhomboid family serine protease
MWFLYVFGDNVESSAISGTCCCTGAARPQRSPTRRPSRHRWCRRSALAIAAVLGAYIVMYPSSRIHTLVFLGFFITVTELPALAMLGFWFVLQFLQGALSLVAQPQASGVAWFAHIGGFLTGVAVAWWLRARGRLERPSARYQIWYRH